MAYLPQTVEELNERYRVRHLPWNKEKTKFLEFIGSKDEYQQKNETIWFSQFVVQDLIQHAINDVLDKAIEIKKERGEWPDEPSNDTESN